jgi:hypothetical protein
VTDSQNPRSFLPHDLFSLYYRSLGITQKKLGVDNSPDAHAVHEGVGAIRWPDAAVLLEHCDVPHKLIHDLGELDRVGGWARAAAACSGPAVSHVVLVVRAVEVLSIPASKEGEWLARHFYIIPMSVYGLFPSETEEELTPGR